MIQYGLMESVVVGAKLGIFGCFKWRFVDFTVTVCFVSSILVRFTQLKSVESLDYSSSSNSNDKVSS